jgi:carbon-monoxide dehydrogenase medium subunit
MLYFEPNFIDEALVLLDRFGSGARILAGGTRLGPRLREHRDDAAALVNVKRIEELHAITRSARSLRVGAAVTANQLSTSPDVRECVPLLAEAAQTLGARQLRSVATLGGNVCSGDPVSDLTAALLASDAACEIVTLAEGPTRIALERLVTKASPVLATGELLSAVEIPLADGVRSSYQKVMTRRSFELALIAVAASVHFDDPTVVRARLALAGAAPLPVRASHTEAFLAGKRLDRAAIAQAAELAAREDARPADDHRAGAEYRRQLVAVLTARALQALAPAGTDGRT